MENRSSDKWWTPRRDLNLLLKRLSAINLQEPAYELFVDGRSGAERSKLLEAELRLHPTLYKRVWHPERTELARCHDKLTTFAHDELRGEALRELNAKRGIAEESSVEQPSDRDQAPLQVAVTSYKSRLPVRDRGYQLQVAVTSNKSRLQVRGRSYKLVIVVSS